MENKKSFREKVESTNQKLSAFVCIVVVLFCMTAYWNSSCYNQVFEGYSDLQQYYEAVKQSSDDMKKYLTIGESAYLSEYDTSMRIAENGIRDLSENPVIKDQWRFRLLQNMLNEYKNSAQELMEQYTENEDVASYRKYYEIFLKNERLIQETSTGYYHLITETMNQQKANLSFAQTLTYLMILIASLTIIFWTRYFSKLFYHTISKPLQKVLESIALIKQGEYNLEMESQSSLEMEEICVALEEMAGKIALNMETQKEKAELEKKLAQSELKMLQNQINPHFLFNTLNTIYCMAEQEGAYDASQMLLKTSHLLRYGLEMQNRLSDLERELHALAYYIEIQQKRFDDKISFHIEVENENEIKHISIPAMILQPLVENALQHGLKDCVKDGTVSVRIRKCANRLIIQVSDNGQGMSEADLSQLIANDYHKKDGEGLGLYNVVHRLKMYCQDIDIALHSAIGEGFDIKLTVSV